MPLLSSSDVMLVPSGTLAKEFFAIWLRWMTSFRKYFFTFIGKAHCLMKRKEQRARGLFRSPIRKPSSGEGK